MDYEEKMDVLHFVPCQKTACTTINTIHTACILEEDREFSVVLDKLDLNGDTDRIMLGVDEAKVTINDADG